MEQGRLLVLLQLTWMEVQAAEMAGSLEIESFLGSLSLRLLAKAELISKIISTTSKSGYHFLISVST